LNRSRRYSSSATESYSTLEHAKEEEGEREVGEEGEREVQILGPAATTSGEHSVE
jgi:hypothetical protein